MSARYKYDITGSANGKPVVASCVAKDTFAALQMFKDVGIYVHTIPSRKQVHADTEIGIKSAKVIRSLK